MGNACSFSGQLESSQAAPATKNQRHTTAVNPLKERETPTERLVSIPAIFISPPPAAPARHASDPADMRLLPATTTEDTEDSQVTSTHNGAAEWGEHTCVVAFVSDNQVSGLVVENCVSQSSSLASARQASTTSAVAHGPQLCGLEYSLRSDMSELILDD